MAPRIHSNESIRHDGGGGEWVKKCFTLKFLCECWVNAGSYCKCQICQFQPRTLVACHIPLSSRVSCLPPSYQTVQYRQKCPKNQTWHGPGAAGMRIRRKRASAESELSVPVCSETDSFHHPPFIVLTISEL